MVEEAEAEEQVDSTMTKTPLDMPLVVEVVVVLADLQVKEVQEEHREQILEMVVTVVYLETNLLVVEKVVVVVRMMAKHLVEQVVMVVGTEETLVLMEILAEADQVVKVATTKVVQVVKVELV